MVSSRVWLGISGVGAIKLAESNYRKGCILMGDSDLAEIFMRVKVSQQIHYQPRLADCSDRDDTVFCA